MKKLVSIMAVAAFMLSMNVNAQEPKQKAKKEKAKTETIIIEKQVESPKAEESDGTSLSVGGDGVEFSTKDGAKKTEVIIK